MTNQFGIGMYIDSQYDVNRTCGIRIGITPSGSRMPGNIPERHGNLESPCHLVHDLYEHANKVAGHINLCTQPRSAEREGGENFSLLKFRRSKRLKI